MRLFIHVGTEKTGSSHIQTLCVTRRIDLQTKKIWFPEGITRHEKRMRVGLVSAGNGFLLAELERLGKQSDAEDALKGNLEAAESMGCDAVLLSSELFLPYCVKRGVWSNFFECCDKVGFRDISVLVVLRDPIEQLISLYKHRAKSGTAGHIGDWAGSGYRLPQELAALRHAVVASSVQVNARGYSRRDGYLENLFFREWLGVEPPAPLINGQVNPSLTLSELVLIRQMADRRPVLVTPLYEALLTIDPGDKVQGEAMVAHARAVATEAVAAHAEEWAAWNQYLPPNEALTIPEAPAEIPPRPRELGLTDHQMAALAVVIDEAATSRFVARMLWQSRIRPFLGRVKRLVAR